MKNLPEFLNNLKEHVEKLAERFCTMLFFFIDSVQNNVSLDILENSYDYLIVELFKQIHLMDVVFYIFILAYLSSHEEHDD